VFDYSVTFATLNCLDYTRQCVDSLERSGTPLDRIVVVDNCSTDGTQDYLSHKGLGKVVFNKQNLSCGAAWNQGIFGFQTEWTIVMNNDIVVAKDFAEKLIGYALKNNLKMVSPARVDGLLNYDFEDFADASQNKMTHVARAFSSNAICMCIHWSLFNEIGFFRSHPALLGFEDAIFFNDLRHSKLPHATTGSVWIHHFGSVTQEHLKMVLGITARRELVVLNDKKLLHQSWLDRKIQRYQSKVQFRQWRREELESYGMTLHAARPDSTFIWL
jgi:N-acetylglucosaminyl-diphospho-decaprenol L-rhamnosyltransferase